MGNLITYKSTNSIHGSFSISLDLFKKSCIEQRSIEKPLTLLQNTFQTDVRLPSTREIYPVYEALTVVSDQVAKKNIPTITHAWEKVLRTLQGRKIYRIKQGDLAFDTKLAQAVTKRGLEVLQRTIQVNPLDLSLEKNRQDVIDYVYHSTNDIFNFAYTKGFTEEIIRSKSVRCLVARDQSQAIVGILWGFLDKAENKSLFHFWELSREPAMAHMGIAKKLMEYAKQQQVLYPELQFATLNVDSDNLRAKGLYENALFAPLDQKEKDAAKIFMSQALTNNSNKSQLSISTKQVVTNFVLATIPLYRLLIYELIRRCKLLWGSLRYR